MKTYSPVEDNRKLRYNEQSYRDGYGSEVEVSVDMVPQKDGSVISKEEWYVWKENKEKIFVYKFIYIAIVRIPFHLPC